ncbi:diaminopropionate ammonia-lyase [Alicyclobacillus tolerans]|uniref:diaminopropionate ammonia-lyase n=1 Tax=Alicyclobacillus tolerans TaxID=90970 RepID=UPI001EFF69AF|nr:diaminopropionate ammonia-lyase [Alicyclobacillus tolerans]MCF8567922.1 diaminopropionate ammonia-lyase [Alicyclobacillus tolerans]
MTVRVSLKHLINDRSRTNETIEELSLHLVNQEVIEKVRNFHKSFPGYQMTPLHTMRELSRRLHVQKIWIKDESYRFGLNAFKALGGSYAIGRYLANQLNIDISELSFERLKSRPIKEQLGDIVFVTATDGNHGRGIAWAARQVGQKSVVFMPKGSSQFRLNDIKQEGAQASITELNYDDTVRFAKRYADRHRAVLVQDTAWEGYEQIPTWIMQGYFTLMDEAMEQIEQAGDEGPTHVFLQAGVGSFAASVAVYLSSKYGESRPTTVIVEPDNAACLYTSASINDGKPHAVTGELSTIMAGLACGEPSTVAWKVLRDYADMYISCPDDVSAKAMRMLGNPLPGDPRIISGESGAVGLGVLSLIQEEQELQAVASQLQLDANSRILLISTEGATDPESYRKIVWDGMYPSI